MRTFRVFAAILLACSSSAAALTIQQTTLTLADAAAGDAFGRRIAVSGTTLIVGANGRDESGVVDQGAAYVYVLSGGVWTLQQKLTAPDLPSGGFFGWSVAIDGNTAVVGAPGDNIGSNVHQGSAYVFVRSGTIWTLQAKLLASDARANDECGATVAVSSDTALVSCYYHDLGSQEDAGAVWVFVRAGASWYQQAKLVGGSSARLFGYATVVDADTAVIGAPEELVDAISGRGGAVYAFRRSAGTWIAPNEAFTWGESSLRIGTALAFGADRLVAGRIPLGSRSGEASVYRQTALGQFTRESPHAQVTRGGLAPEERFGTSVAIAGSTVCVGAPGTTASGGAEQGDAGVFVLTGSGWREQFALRANDAAAGDHFGSSLAAAGDLVFVGVPDDDVGARVDSGSVRVFDLATLDTDDDGLPDRWESQFGLSPTSSSGNDGASGDPDGDTRTNLQEFQAGTHPRGLASATRYLAEGATGAFFDTRIVVANPGTATATVLLRFLKTDGTAASQVLSVPARARRSTVVDTVSGMASAEFSTVVETDQPVVVDRTMWWTSGEAYGTHAETAMSGPATTWYLAEGATHSGFDLFYLIQNPNATAASVTVRYLRTSGAPLTKTYTVPGSSRFNLWVNDEARRDAALAGLASTDVSAAITADQPVLVERAMYLNAGGRTFGAGHESAGVTTPATSWFLAEGATGSYFDEFILLANPGGTEAQVTVTYLLPSGPPLVKRYTVPANSRFNIWVDQEDARLADTAVSASITSTQPIVVERSMWWPGPTAASWQEAHNAFGATQTGTVWGLAEGEVLTSGPNTETYILIANTSSFTGSVKVTLLFEDGTAPVEKTFTVAPSSRFNVDVRTEFPAAVGKPFGAVVESLGTTPAQIVVERAMYSNANDVTWAAGTGALATRIR